MTAKFEIIGEPETESATGIVSAMVSINGSVFAVKADPANCTLEFKGKVIPYEELPALLKKIYDTLVGKERKFSDLEKYDEQKSEDDEFGN